MILVEVLSINLRTYFKITPARKIQIKTISVAGIEINIIKHKYDKIRIIPDMFSKGSIIAFPTLSTSKLIILL